MNPDKKQVAVVTGAGSGIGPIRQIGYVVRDLDAGVQQWLEHTGIGPWTCFRNVTLTGRYRGQETAVQIHVALGYQGDMQIELIQVLSDTSSPYQDDNGKRLVGIHHIAWFTRDLESDVARAQERGLKVCFKGENAATRVAYMEGSSEPGTLLEFIEVTDEMAAMFQQGIEQARTWDGRNPVHNIDMG